MGTWGKDKTGKDKSSLKKKSIMKILALCFATSVKYTRRLMQPLRR